MDEGSKISRRQYSTEWLNLIRFLAIFYVLWTHYEYACFAEIFPMGTNIEEMFFFPPALSSWLLYGYTGKYAVAFLCVISGFITAWGMENKNVSEFWRYLLKRYLRLMVPVWGIVTFTLGIRAVLEMESYGLWEIFSGLFIPGSKVFYGHFWCLSSFLIGNCLIFLIMKGVKRLTKYQRTICIWGVMGGDVDKL